MYSGVAAGVTVGGAYIAAAAGETAGVAYAAGNFISSRKRQNVTTPMSALGQKQTCAMHQAMSALLPIATAKADMPQW